MKRGGLLAALMIIGTGCMARAEENPPTSRPAERPTALPGRSFVGELPELTDQEKALSAGLKKHVVMLATEIGERNTNKPEALEKSAQYIEEVLKELGYVPGKQTYRAGGVDVRNIDCEIKGTTSPEEIVVVGAHYDSAQGTPGANDNATGVAPVLELAKVLRETKPERTVRFVFFVNEEPPFFRSPGMGSLVYAKRCGERKEKIVAMLTPETIGYCSDAAESQHYPSPFDKFFPSVGNFIAFVGNVESGPILREAIGTFRETTQFPSEGIAAPDQVIGVGFSDHWSFWQHGYPAVMLTDTAMFRYSHYHDPTDTPDKINFDKTARVVSGLGRVVEKLASPS